MKNELIQKAQKIEHGFKDILTEAQGVVQSNSATDCVRIARELYSSGVHQARMLATFVLGFVAARSKDALNFLHRNISGDENWRVQEILAKAFDQYCEDTGYKKSLPVIKAWLKDKNPNVRRAVSEGLRIWTGREYFKDNPGIAVKLLSKLKDDKSEYVRISAGNALKDISKKHKTLVKAEVATWDISDKKIAQTYKLASKFLR